MGHRIRALAAAVVVLAGLAGCAAGRSGVSSSADCAAMLKFRGQTYGGSSLRTHPPYDRVARISAAHLHPIGRGVFPPCQDTGPSAPAEHALSVQVARIDGVDPGTAVAVLPDGSVFIKSASLAVIESVVESAHGIRWDYSS
jgi:Family of unknown function (DUF6281)